MVTNWFDYLFYEIADRRVETWPFMANPLPLALIIITYLIVVNVVGPRFMQNREAFNLKGILAVYNSLMVFICIYILKAYYECGFTLYSLVRCIDVDYSDHPVAVRILSIMWWTHIIKMVELVETLFFIMRKKGNQVSFLHVYHHASTLFLTWIGVKYVGGGMVIFSYILNFGVHVLMYSYYFAALFGRSVQSHLRPVKKLLTMVQMVQFVLMLIQCIVSVLYHCAIPVAVLAMYFPNISLNLFLFAKFYKRSYNKTTKKQD